MYYYKNRLIDFLTINYYQDSTTFLILYTFAGSQKTVADATEFYEHPDTKETIWFVRMFDKAFDRLNGQNLTKCKLRRKPDLRPCQ